MEERRGTCPPSPLLLVTLLMLLNPSLAMVPTLEGPPGVDMKNYIYAGDTVTVGGVQAYDADSNATAAGTIAFDNSVVVCQFLYGSGATTATTSCNMSFTMWRVDYMTNRTMINFTIYHPMHGSFENYINPYYMACVQVADLAAPTVRSDRLCYYYYIQLPPFYVPACPPFSSYCYLDNALQLQTYLGVGQYLDKRVYFKDNNAIGITADPRMDSVQIDLVSDPGYPNSMNIDNLRGGLNDILTASVFTNLISVRFDSLSNPGYSQYFFSRGVKFTPDLSQAGLKYRFCFTAREIHSSTFYINNVSASNQTNLTCFAMEVVLPNIQVQGSVVTNGTMDNPTYLDLTVGCDYSWNFTSWEARDFPSTASSIDYMGFQQGLYKPHAIVDQSNPLPPGATLSSREAVKVCWDRTLACTSPTYEISRQEIRYTPTRGQQSLQMKACLVFQDQTYPNLQMRVFCTIFRVNKCKVCIRTDETLLKIAHDYRIDWLQLWSANIQIQNPYALGTSGVLLFGPTFPIIQNTSIADAALRFRTPERSLRSMNPELLTDWIPPGTILCVVPDICQTMSQM
ncbi:hypothetical protein GUITHDRAFT_101060 [Guillardia theta CCMP2712]|uniref:LysM domain-containing protein n=1 Tax=Guillardia theta (strain CCMP2712) TaxID=905079 RepID=L1JXR8_GUITC|nr:hypothetical protein GUITHDRAFT_101060 [Guillardia theta CCMP2712]EKX53356.1 hypothetical protein GUITHDRAFT_101060 [Guillardia theta CCMP2712]|eukprot:XP_005840336.1 hypothetical protein GUITHDRAFT_101060 [Guillardia theta CCMP2712]